MIDADRAATVAAATASVAVDELFAGTHWRPEELAELYVELTVRIQVAICVYCEERRPGVPEPSAN